MNDTERAAEEMGAYLFLQMVKESRVGHVSEMAALNKNLRALTHQLKEQNKAPTWKDHAVSVAKPLLGMAALHLGGRLLKSKGMQNSFVGKAMKTLGSAASEKLDDVIESFF